MGQRNRRVGPALAGRRHLARSVNSDVAFAARPGHGHLRPREEQLGRPPLGSLRGGAQQGAVPIGSELAFAQHGAVGQAAAQGQIAPVAVFTRTGDVERKPHGIPTDLHVVPGGEPAQQRVRRLFHVPPQVQPAFGVKHLERRSVAGFGQAVGNDDAEVLGAQHLRPNGLIELAIDSHVRLGVTESLHRFRRSVPVSQCGTSGQHRDQGIPPQQTPCAQNWTQLTPSSRDQENQVSGRLVECQPRWPADAKRAC